MPIHISVEAPEDLVIQSLFGASYGTVAQHTMLGQFEEAPVLFTCVHPVGDYAPVVETMIAHALPVGQRVAMIGSGTGTGPFREIPVIEVMVDRVHTLSEILVMRGLAIPDPTVMATHLRQPQLLEAIRYARAARSGIWGESGMTAATVGLTEEEAKATAPPAMAPEWFNRFSILTMLVLLGIIAWRESHWRHMRQVNPSRKDNRGLLGRAVAVVVGRADGMFKPMPNERKSDA